MNVYAVLLRKRQVQVVVGSSVIAGLAVAIALPIVLMVHAETGSFAEAGAVAAALAIASGISSPPRGRILDRYGQARTLPLFAIGSALTYSSLVWATLDGADTVVLIMIAALAGLLHPPLLSSTRPLWADLVDDPAQLGGAYALQALLLEVFFISGPLVAAALIAVASPAAAVLALAVAELVGILALWSTPVSRAWRPQARSVGRAGAMASRGMQVLIATDVPIGVMFGVLDVGVPAFTSGHGTPAAAGVVIAALAVGSLIGGVLYGGIAGSPSPGRYAVLLAAVAICCAPLPLASSVLALGILMAIAGVFVAPMNSVGLGLIDDVAPPGTAAEATSWTGAAYQGGLAAGTAFAGAIVDGAGTDPVFICASAFAALSAAIAWVGREKLRGPGPPRSAASTAVGDA